MSDPKIKPGSLWRRKSGDNLIARVRSVEYGCVQFEAPWTSKGVARKCMDSFLMHYRPVRGTYREALLRD